MSEKFNARAALAAAEDAVRAGDPDGAFDAYLTVVARFPAHEKAARGLARLWRGLGAPQQHELDAANGALGRGEMDAAAAGYRRLIARLPSEGGLYNLLGIALAQAGRPDLALAAARVAVRLMPAHPEARANLGGILVALGRHVEAVAELHRALAAKPAMPEAENALGNAERGRGRADLALCAYERALKLRPDYVNALNGKASALRDQGDARAAVAAARAALALAPGDTEIRQNLAWALADAGENEAAVEELDRVLAAEPANATALYAAGVQLGRLGRAADAEKRLRAALSADPRNAEPYRDIAAFHRFTTGDPLIEEMRKRLEGADDDARMHLSFALGKANDEVGNTDAAFAHYLEANRIKRAQIPYGTAFWRALFDRVRDVTTPEWGVRLAAGANASALPIFVLGLNRSGTTLTETILGSHSDVHPGDERLFIENFGTRHLDQMSTWAADDLAAFSAAYLADLSTLSPLPRITDKMPINFLWIGLIAAAFPNARIIHMIRDPRDIGWSNFRQHFMGLGNSFAYDLKEFAEFYGLYADLMAHWHAAFPGRIFDLHYADLVGNQEAESRRLLAHCGLAWEEGVLEFHKAKRSVSTASIAQVRRGVYSTSVAAWKRYEAHLQPMIAHLAAHGRLPPDQAD